jgi:hypothetical protein
MTMLETEMSEVLTARLEQHREDAISLLVAHGYKVTKPKARTVKIERPKLNAVGKPYGASYDPKYRMKYKSPKYPSRVQEVGDGISPERWTQMCALAQRQWDITHKPQPQALEG